MVVSQLRSQYGDRARHHLVSHHNIGPDRVQELLSRNHVPLPAGKKDEHIHHFWFEDARLIGSLQEVFLRINLPVTNSKAGLQLVIHGPSPDIRPVSQT
jgi:hypothetical protein